MQITVPKYFEDIIKRYLKQTFYTAQNRAVFADREFTSKDLRFFAEGASALSDLFTSERASLPLNYLNDKKLRAGYLLYFLPLNFCKAQGVLQQLPLAFFKKNRFKILDMGCGPGTFTLGFIDYLLQREIVSKKEKVIIEILALDHNYHILKDADLLHAEIGKYLKAQGCEWRVVISAKTFDLRRGKPDTLLKNDQYDLIVASNFMNEWTHTKAEDKVKFLEKIYQRHLHKEGFLVLVDPALQRPSRALQEIRDVVAKKKSLHIFAPCLHDKDCPMLKATDRDWCHFYISWKEPPFLKELDKLLKNKNEYLKCSYMIFSAKNISAYDTLEVKAQKHQVHRAVSNLMGSKGKSELVLCGPSGRWHITRLDKSKSPSNKSFTDLKRGDLVYLEKIPPKVFELDGEAKIEKEDKIQIVSTFE